MSTWSISYCVVVLGWIIVICVGRRYLGYTKPNLPLPPGPPGLPWIGNVIGVNPNAPWLTYHEWAKKYGDLIHSQILGRDVVIISSEKIAKDLLDKRSLNNSDRPHIITSDLCGIGFNFALMRYGDRWRLNRRLFHQTFRKDAVARFVPLQHRKACQFLRHLFSNPEKLDGYVFEYTAAIILGSTYDYDPSSQHDELIGIVAKVQEVVLSVLRLEITITIEAFPVLLKLPAWFPGMSFKDEMATARKLANHYVETAFGYSLQRVRDCSTTPSMVHDTLRNMGGKGTVPDESQMTALKEAAATAFLTGSETSHAVLMAFFLVMMSNPEVQEKAQTQIDAVVGRSRLPSFSDRRSLPLVDAILWETLRCYPVAPLSAPHTSVNDDVYNGFYIPKGSILLTNLWSMGHDESRYPNPHAFMPERFLDEKGFLKPIEMENIAFGFGRRICVGRHLADMSVWGLIAKILAVFKILKPLDEKGMEISVEPKFSTGLAIHPLPFGYRIVPRWPAMDTEKLEEMITASTA